MIISFSGLDGSGKTQQAGFARRHIEGLGHACRVRHAIKDSLRHRLLHSFIGKFLPKTKDSLEDGLRSKKASPKTFFLRAVKKFFLFAELIYFRARYGSYIGKKDKSVICDRYFYDELIQTDYLEMAGRGFAGVYKKLIPRPDIAFLLKVDPHLARKRKNEYDEKYFTRKKGMYDNLSAMADVREINDGGIEAVRGVIASSLKKLYS